MTKDHQKSLQKQQNRKYLPFTSPKRFTGKNRKSKNASKRLAFILSKFDRNSELVFDDLILDAIYVEFTSPHNPSNFSNYRRLTASRAYFILFPEITYIRKKATPLRSLCIESEKEALKAIYSRNQNFINKVQFFHPFYFFMSATPDAVRSYENKFCVIEIKTIFKRDKVVLNEMNGIFEETSDISKWLHQLQFSMLCCCVDRGMLIIFDYESNSIFKQIELKLESDFEQKFLDKWKEMYVSKILFGYGMFREFSDAAKNRFRSRIIRLLDSKIEETKLKSKIDNVQKQIEYGDKRLKKLFDMKQNVVVLNK